MRHGYYLAKQERMVGDDDHATMAACFWRILGHACPGNYDGVSVWGDGAERCVAFTMVDFFTGAHPPKVVQMLLADAWEAMGASGDDEEQQ